MLVIVASFKRSVQSVHQRRAFSMAATSLFDFEVDSIDNEKVALASYKGKAKAFILVNLASK